MNSKVYSWKNKIDPSFDKIIKSYLEAINYAGLPANSGWIILEDSMISRWEKEGMKSWADPGIAPRRRRGTVGPHRRIYCRCITAAFFQKTIRAMILRKGLS